jgi:hypothetical protein
LSALWNGRLPLARAFWEYAILYGTLASLAGTAAAFAALAVDLPVTLAIVLHFLPLPYVIAAAVGVWRSAEKFEGAQHWADTARVAIIAWVLVMIVV